MSTDMMVILSNVLVAITSIIAAAATEHDAVKAMRDTVLGLVRYLPVKGSKHHHKDEEPQADDEDVPDNWGDMLGPEEDKQ